MTPNNEFNGGDVCCRISSDLSNVIFYDINTRIHVLIYLYLYLSICIYIERERNKIIQARAST